jgi:hypothetical protein
VYPALFQCTYSVPEEAGRHRTVANCTGGQYRWKCLILREFLLIGEPARTRKNQAGEADGAQGRNRTTDTAIFSRMLYQLSYLGVPRREPCGHMRTAVYSGVGRRCPPGFAVGFAGRGPARMYPQISVATGFFSAGAADRQVP